MEENAMAKRKREPGPPASYPMIPFLDGSARDYFSPVMKSTLPSYEEVMIAGGNLTGLTNFSEVLASKQIDLLRDLMPRLSRLGVLVSTSNPLHTPQLRDIEQATNEAGLLLMPFEVPRPEALDSPGHALPSCRQ
jgi:ABC-type uncharacterized transport system substrate-binding protein